LTSKIPSSESIVKRETSKVPPPRLKTRMVRPPFTFLYVRLPALVDNLEGEVLDVRLDLGIAEFTTNETFSVENAAKTKSVG
jgi:hypothetical protein